MALDTQGGDDDMAVILRNAEKSYDKGNTRVLNKLNMTVPRGCIYGLLGASGCGKTTLLNVLVGLLKLDEGEVKVLGGTPGKKNSAVPGPRIGYMPQESALVEEFYVKDVIYYFGWLNGMKKEDIQSRYEFLSNLLELPPDDRVVKDLSGGQLRRLSFASAIVQSPQILILDEPTVGQDPVLRHKIWNYMLKLSNEDNVTIVITTHYIAEATEAHRVGLLRNGTLLAETSPTNLLIQLNCATLEDVSFILSQRQTQKRNGGSNDNNHIELPTTSATRTEELEEEFVVKPHREGPSEKLKSSTISRMKALLYKNFIKLFRNIPGFVFIFGFPLLHCGCFFLAMYGDPYHIPIGIVNEELGNCYNLPGGIEYNSGFELLEEDDCRFRGLSCLYIDQINNYKVDIVYYNTLKEGLEATKSGHTYSTVYFQKNFSQSMQVRLSEGFSVNNATLKVSEISVWMDMSDYTIGNGLKVHFIDKYKKLLEYVAAQCNFTNNVIAIPLTINDPVYGEKDSSFGSFVGPAFLLSMISFMTTTYSATVILLERTEGVWDRNLVAGVTTAEIVASHWCSQLFVMLIQIVEMLVLASFMFDAHIVGSLWAVILLMFLQGLCGNAFGIFISGVTSSVTMAYITSMGSFFPYIILCGIIWPIEAMPYALRLISLCLPGTWSCIAIRNVLFRGWEVTHASVYPGFLIPIVWFVLFTGIGSFGIKKR